MIKVTELTYSKKDFKDILRTVTPIQDDDQKMGLDPFPSTADLAIFANDVYSDKDDLTSDNHCRHLPKDWKLLTTVDGSKGYFGCLYFNSSRQQVVLAHRGTVPLVLGTVYADLKSVVLNKYTDYMFSAITLGDKIKCAILDLNKQNGVRFTLTVTGHSLGGWISQVTAITLKHLKRQGDVFVRVYNNNEGIHAHTVVFDSPGVQDMAIKIQRDYGRYDSTTYSMFRSLDISTLFMAVNYVNTAGFHLGAMYLISPKLDFTPGYKNFLAKYFTLNSNTHSMKHFTKAFKADNVKFLQVKDWPQGWGERIPVHKLEKDQGTYNPDPDTVAGPSVRYNKGEEDSGSTFGLHRFSEVELDYVNLIRMVRQHEIPGSKIETFFGAKFQDLFPNFTIDRKEKTVTLDNEPNLKKFVNSIKNALRWYSVELQNVMEEQKKNFTLPNILLDMLSQEYVDSIPDLPDCEDPLRLCEFTNNRNTARVLYVQAADCSLEIARIYSILCSSYPDECIFLTWGSVLKLNNHLTTKGLPLDNNYNLFVINIGSTTEIAQVQEFLKNVFSKFSVYPKKKAVIVSQINPDLCRLVKSELAILCLPPSEEKFLEFTFNDLKDTSRRELLSKEFIILGEQAMSLNSLLGENCQSSASIDDVLKPFLKDLLTDESFKLNIPNNLLKFDQLDVMFSKINREADMASLSKLLLEEKCFLFVSSNVRQLLEPQLQEVPRAAERVLDVSGSSEEGFRQACLENSSVHIAFWLAATDGRIFLKEVFNRSFYLLRQFHNQTVVDLIHLVQEKNDVDLFVFVGVTDIATLMRYFNASPEFEKLFSTNLKFKCFQDSTMAENAEGINQYVRHTLEVVKKGEGYLLVWRDSQGALNSLLPCLSTDSRPLSEDELCARKVVIISDKPGMGKSTTLTSLSRHMANSWVFRINLRDRPADITNLPAQMSVESVAHFLADASCEPATLSLLRFCLQSQDSRQVHVLLDGFDEIKNEDDMEKILKLCHFLKNETTTKIIVTTRDSYRDVLVNRLSTVATIFKEITKEIQLNFLTNFWHSHALLGQKEERLWLFAQHLYEAAHEKLGTDIIRLIGIPLHTRMLAEAFLQQAEEFIDNVEPHPDIIGINNIYNLYNKFIGVKRDIYLKEKISFSSYDSNSSCEMLIVNHYVLAFEILDPEFQKKYIVKGGINRDEINRFGLTQWNRETHCDFIHRTFAEFFCSQLLVLWLRRENFSYKFLPIEEWFLGNLLINKDFKVVRKFMDEHLAEVTLAEDSKQLLYDNMSKCWSNNAEAFRNEDGETALHVAVKEANINIIDLLLGGLATEQTREPFESILLARDYKGNTALKTGLKILHSISTYVSGSHLPIESGIKHMLKISHLSYEQKFKLLLYTVFEDTMFKSQLSNFLLTCALNEKDKEDFQKTLNRIEFIQDEILFKAPGNYTDLKPETKFIENFILNEQNDIVERKFLPLAVIRSQTFINIECLKGNYWLINHTIKINQDVVNSRDSCRRTPLHCAARGGHIKLVTFLHQQGASLNACDFHGRTALSFAAENGNQDVVKYLLKHKADFNLSNHSSKSLLHYAIVGGHVEMVKYLISEVKVDVNCSDDKGLTPLHYAIEGRDKEIIKYLISEGKVDTNCLIGGRTPLIYAVRGGHKEIVKYIISEGKVDINCLINDKTPLHYAIWEGQTEIVKYLISEAKVDVNRSGYSGRTPLYYALKGGHEEIVKYLISEVKVDVNCSDNGGRTPLHHAIWEGQTEIAKYLISKVKVDLNCSDNSGLTPLHYAVEARDEEIVKYLISEVKLDINCLDNKGMTPLHHAIWERDKKIVKYLISEAKVDVNCSDYGGKTSLHYAIDARDEEIVKYLISEAKVGRCQLFGLWW